MVRKYPSQEDAQLLVDIMNHEGVYTGACSSEFRKLGDKYNGRPVGWKRLYEKAFGVKSPWNYRFNKKGNHKRELFWDKDKAIMLSI